MTTSDRPRDDAGHSHQEQPAASVAAAPTRPDDIQSDARWRDRRIDQRPEWADQNDLDRVSATLATRPPLVYGGEVDQLRERLAAAERGEAFLLQGGDCAETFDNATRDRIRAQVKTLLQMAVVLTYGASVPVIKVGRLAGQFAKPRSSATETREGQTLPAYRGDAVNGFEFSAAARRADPERLLQAYHTSASTLNLVRAYSRGGFADLHQVREWNRGFVAEGAYMRYETMAHDIDRAIAFMQACGVDFGALRGVEMYASHEALLLDYERALTRFDVETGRWYGGSGHFLWLGERTRDVAGAHAHYLAGIENPIGVKLGPSTTNQQMTDLVELLDPQRQPGRLTFITRLGSEQIRDVLPRLIEAARSVAARPVWVCDPMHGNTFASPSGHKTRRFDAIMEEVSAFFDVHRAQGSVPGGVHVEYTGQDVTEVLGGAGQIDEAALACRYETVCDPRLNHQQSLELAFLVAQMLKERRC